MMALYFSHSLSLSVSRSFGNVLIVTREKKQIQTVTILD